MALNAYPERSSVPEHFEHVLRLVGAGAAAPTAELGTGAGVTITRVALGQYRLTWAESPGTYVGAWFQYAQNTYAAGDAVLFTVDHDSFTASGLALDFFVTDPGTDEVGPAAAELATTDRVYVRVLFRRGGVSG